LKPDNRYERFKYFYDNKCPYILGQYAFGAIPKHPFIKSLIDGIHNNIYNIITSKKTSINHEWYIYYTTGPDYVTQKYLEYNNVSNPITIIHNKNNLPQFFGDYAQHLMNGSWKKNVYN